MALDTNAHARVHDTFWHKSHRCPMTLKSSACVNYPWITFAKPKEFEKEGVTTLESSEQISAGLDAIARYFFARALRNNSKRVVIHGAR